jgi:hypothetical protein
MTRVMKGERSLSRGAAIKLFQVRGIKLGPIANASDDEIDVLERLA